MSKLPSFGIKTKKSIIYLKILNTKELRGEGRSGFAKQKNGFLVSSQILIIKIKDELVKQRVDLMHKL